MSERDIVRDDWSGLYHRTDNVWCIGNCHLCGERCDHDHGDTMYPRCCVAHCRSNCYAICYDCRSQFVCADCPSRPGQMAYCSSHTASYECHRCKRHTHFVCGSCGKPRCNEFSLGGCDTTSYAGQSGYCLHYRCGALLCKECQVKCSLCRREYCKAHETAHVVRCACGGQIPCGAANRANAELAYSAQCSKCELLSNFVHSLSSSPDCPSLDELKATPIRVVKSLLTAQGYGEPEQQVILKHLGKV
jgi:hypothetical protein